MKKFFTVIFLVCMIILGFFIAKKENINNIIANKTQPEIIVLHDDQGSDAGNYINSLSEPGLLNGPPNCSLPTYDKYIRINMPTPLSYKSRSEIFNSRINYVNQSIFTCNNYKPSSYVFGGIQSGKPWMSTNMCRYRGKPADVTGNAEETRDINNPSIPISIDWLYGLYYEQAKKPGDCYYLLMPKSAKYIASEKTIEVVYEFSLFGEDNEPITFKGLNAIDLGYKYAHLDTSKSKNIVRFRDNNYNISTHVVEFKDYIHTGLNCRVEGGCNNASPQQPFLNFFYTKNSSDAVLYFKLWKERPESKDTPADINEIMIIKNKNSYY